MDGIVVRGDAHVSDEKMSKDVLPDGLSVPEGVEYLELVRALEDACAAETWARIPELGVKTPSCYAQLGTLLSLLDRLSSCSWGCSQGNHLIEYVTGRACSHARAAIRLTGFGFYDEALNLARSIGEAANLFFLFVNDRSELEKWRAADDAARNREYGPVKVRLLLEERKLLIPIGQQRYRLLSGRAVHINPGTKPQVYNRLQLPSGGGILQEAGLLVALNELAYAVALLSLSAAQLADIGKEPRLRILKAARTLVESIGRAELETLPEAWEQLAPKEPPTGSA
jgi:hypothetical protein